jgi:16S rRNA (guanine527-N7)-methyltransferase
LNDRPGGHPSTHRDAPPALSAGGRKRLGAWLDLLARERASVTSVREPAEAWKVHVDDSLSGIEFVSEAVSGAGAIADVGSGAGFPGAPLAVALPDVRIDLIESVARKCEFLRRAIVATEIPNLRVVCERAETWAGRGTPDGGREAYDVVAARAVGRLSTLAELAVPLLRREGVLVAWKGRRDPEEEGQLERAGDRLAMKLEEVRWVGPYAGSRNRHLYVVRKSGSTPEDLPRRPGMAKKRPFG